MAHFLFGPTDDVTFRDRFLCAPCEEGRWTTFSAETSSFADAWMDVSRNVDALFLWCGNVAIPSWVWSVPVPLIALAPEPHLYWHPYRQVLARCDLVITDSPGTERFHRSGWDHARPGNLQGLDQYFFKEIEQSAGERDIDILFVGDLNPAVQTTWLPWIGRLSALGDRFKVLIATGVSGAEYRSLLRRSKLAFNFSSHGECNRRALEAAAAGAVLLQEAENLEVATYLTPGTEFVPYTQDDFESVVTRLLASVHERQGLLERAKERVRSYRFDALIEKCVGFDGPEWPEVRERTNRRISEPVTISLAERMWQRVARLSPESDETLIVHLKEANDHYAQVLLARSPAEAEPHLAACARQNRVAAVGWVSALCDLGRVSEAVEVLRVLVGDLDANPGLTPIERETVPYPSRFDFLRVGWERAGYDHSADRQAEIQTKVALLKCRAYSVLAARTGELSAFQRAAQACPHLPAARAALGCAYARAGQLAEAIPHLSFAAENDPFDHPAATALAAAFSESGDAPAAARFLSARRILAQAAPGLVPSPGPAAPLLESAPSPPPAPTLPSARPHREVPSRL
jgi:tetratricopeptide (TPR) repeat protein